MGIIGWILLGIVGGVIAKALLPGNDPGGLIITVHHRHRRCAARRLPRTCTRAR